VCDLGWLDAGWSPFKTGRQGDGNPRIVLRLPTRLCRGVIWACRPALLAIKGVLGDARQPISAVARRHLRTFLTDPSASPLFGTDPTTARRAAEQLQRSFTGHPERR
jgi:hypothetical protein